MKKWLSRTHNQISGGNMSSNIDSYFHMVFKEQNSQIMIKPDTSYMAVPKVKQTTNICSDIVHIRVIYQPTIGKSNEHLDTTCTVYRFRNKQC